MQTEAPLASHPIYLFDLFWETEPDLETLSLSGC